MRELLKLRNSNGQIAVYVAPADSSVGTLVCVHGGPGGDHHGNNNIFTDVAQYCVSEGFNIIQFDMFGAGQSDGGPADISITTQLNDYESVLAFAFQHFTGPVHVIGESMGATVAALAWKPTISTYLLLWPAFDLRDTDLRPYLSEKWRRSAELKGYIQDGDTIIGHQFLSELDQQDFSECFRLPACPCLIVHGKHDSAVPFQQSLEAIRQAAGECVLFAHALGDHGLQRTEEREFTHAAIKWWLRRHR